MCSDQWKKTRKLFLSAYTHVTWRDPPYDTSLCCIKKITVVWKGMFCANFGKYVIIGKVCICYQKDDKGSQNENINSTCCLHSCSEKGHWKDRINTITTQVLNKSLALYLLNHALGTSNLLQTVKNDNLMIYVMKYWQLSGAWCELYIEEKNLFLHWKEPLDTSTSRNY